jgi:hypothetical protein
VVTLLVLAWLVVPAYAASALCDMQCAHECRPPGALQPFGQCLASCKIRHQNNCPIVDVPYAHSYTPKIHHSQPHCIHSATTIGLDFVSRARAIRPLA